jgi:hypothetical protein
MASLLSRLSKLFLILIPVFLVSTLVLNNVSALSADIHASHDVVPRAILNYGVEPFIANPIQQNPFLASPLQQASTVGQWSSVRQWPLVAIHAAMLQNGNIIMWDRENNATTSMRIYNPQTDTFTKIADPNGASVFCAGFVVLPDNRVLLNGGHLILGDNYGLVDTNIYNPATGAWTSAGDMAQARWYPTTITLGNGRLLTMGGSITPTSVATIPEIFNPATGIWTPIGTITTNQPNIGLYPKLHLLPNGKVLWTYLGVRSKLFDPTNGKWTDVTPTNSSPRAYTSVQYRPGKIMSAGSGQNTAVLDMNQTTPAWRVTQSMSYSRYNLNLTVLPDGDVLAVGGSNNNTNTPASGVLPAELWDADTERWTLLPSMVTPRMYHSMAMLLQDGRVVVAGGGRAGTQTNYLNAEYYSPPYLFKGARPTITYAPSQAPYGANMTVLSPDANSITSAVLISNPNVTHAINQNQRYVPLNFTRNDSGRLTVQLPTNTNLVPPGFYMLFLLNSNGVPSIAPIIKIDANLSMPPPPTATPSGSVTNTPLPSMTPTRTPLPSPTPTVTHVAATATFTPSPVAGSFPTKAIVDNFNRANGGIGANWTGNTGTFAINGSQLNTINGHASIFWSTPFGTTQEVYVTLKSINTAAEEIDLLLKSQSNTTWGSGLLEVWYEPSTQIVRVITFTMAQGWVQRGPNIPVTFAAGDRFGAKARADGFVEVYRNTTLLATVDARGWTYATSGGYTGLWIVNGQNTQLDDFGAG